MTDLTETAIIIVGPVKNRLGNCHKCRAKADQWSARPLGDMGQINVGNVEKGFENIHQGCKKIPDMLKQKKGEARGGNRHIELTLSIGESAVTLESRESVDLGGGETMLRRNMEMKIACSTYVVNLNAAKYGSRENACISTGVLIQKWRGA